MTLFAIPDTCFGLPADIDNIRTDQTFPVDLGETVLISCVSGYKLSGDDTLTCQKGTHFAYDTLPRCILGLKSHFQL